MPAESAIAAHRFRSSSLSSVLPCCRCARIRPRSRPRKTLARLGSARRRHNSVAPLRLRLVPPQRPRLPPRAPARPCHLGLLCGGLMVWCGGGAAAPAWADRGLSHHGAVAPAPASTTAQPPSTTASATPLVRQSLAPETSSAQPPKRPSGGFADEDDLLLDFEEGFLEHPSKKAKTSSSIPTPAAFEAPALSKEVLASSSLPKEKENLSASGGHSIQTAVMIIKDFASQFTLLQAENARLQQDIQSSFAQLDQAVNIAATTRQDADSLRKELGQLKKKLKEEEKEKREAQISAKEKEDRLRNSVEALLGAADIPANTVGKLPAGSTTDVVAFAVDSGELVQALLQKNKAVLSRLHAMIFPKASQDKTLGQLADAFSVDTEGTIEVFKRTSRTYGTLLAFQLLMGYGFKADMELLTTELPKDKDGRIIDLSPFSAPARKCARQLLDLVEAYKSSAGGAAPSLSTQTQDP